MLLYGAPDQETESARNYESLPTFLLARVRDLNQQLTDLRQHGKRAQHAEDAARADVGRAFEEV